MRILKFLAGLGMTVTLMACGGGGGNPGSPSGGTATNPATSASGTTTAGVGSLTLEMVNSTGAKSSTITPLDTFTLRASVKDATGVAVAGQVVTFSGDTSIVKFSSSNLTALTDTAGVATLQISPALSTSAGASVITADVTVYGVVVPQGTLGVQVVPLIPGGAPSVTLDLRNSAGAASSSVNASDIFTLRAVVKDSKGSPVSGQIIKFSGDSTLVKFSPANGSALSDVNGLATVQISPATSTSAGAGIVSADVTVGGTPANQAVMGVQVIPLVTGGSPSITLELKNSIGTTASIITSNELFTVRATVRDSKGVAVVGQVVKFAGDAALVKFTPTIGSALTDSNGVAVVQVSPAQGTSAGASLITADATVAGFSANQVMVGVQVVPLATGGIPSVTLEMRNPAANATTTLAVSDINSLRATVRDAMGNVVAGKSVAFSSSAGHVKFLPSASTITDANGLAVVQVLRNTTTDVGADTITATATVSGVVATPATLDIYVSPSVNAGLSTMTLGFTDIFNAGTTSVPRTGTTYAQVQLLDGNGLAPAPTLVTFTGDATLINFATTALSNSAGFVSIPITAVATSDPRASTLRATATVAGSALSASFDYQVIGGATVVPAQAPVISLLELRNSTGASTPFVTSLDIFTMRATVKDAAGNALAGQVVKFTGDSTLVKFSPVSGSSLTDSTGVAVIQISPAQVTSSGAGYIGADVSVAGIAAKQLTLGMQVMPLPSGGLASITLLDAANATSTTVSALSSNTLRAKVTDALGNALPGQSVNFSSSTGRVKFSPATSALTDLSGVATVDISRSAATSSGTDIVSATVSVGGVPMAPATLTAYVSPLVNGGLPTMTLGVRDATMTSSITTVPRVGTSYARIQLLDAMGVAPVPTLVTISGDASLINFTSTGLTDNTGVALIPMTVVPTTPGGASTLRATASVPSTFGSATLVPVSAAIDYFVPTGSSAGVPTLMVGLLGGGNSVTATGSTKALASVKDASGAAVSGKLVTFVGNPALVKFSPSSGQVLTDSSGIASIIVSPVSILSSGASTLTASTSVGTTPLSTSFDFQLADSSVSLGSLSLGGGLAAYGTRTLSVPVTNLVGGGIPTAPVQVTFAASCGTITPATATTDSLGVASTSYSANGTTGCAGTTVSISASAVSTSTQSGTISVASANATNVQFVSATPQLIYLRDSVGSTQSQLTFRVVDALNNGLSNRNLSLSLSNNATGVSINELDNTVAVPITSDSSGNVSVAVFSGTVPTSFTVKATLLDPASGLPTSVTASSNVLTVAVGRPTQRSLSLSLEKLALEALNVDGQTTNVTLSMADRLGNPVPTGTQVNFVAESGVLVPPTCFTTSISDLAGNTTSQCTVKLRSQGTRTSNGRVAIMAYVAGEEDFVDVNGNNIYNSGDTFAGMDLGRATMDRVGGTGTYGIYDTGEFQVPRVGVSACTAASGCVGDGVWGAADVRTQASVVFASGNAQISTGSLFASTLVAGSSPAVNSLPGVLVTVGDVNGNSMPTGTNVVVRVLDNTPISPAIPSATSITYPSCTLFTSSSYVVQNSLIPKSMNISMTNCVPGDQLQITVTSPLGVVTQQVFSIL